MIRRTWLDAEAPGALRAGEVHVWRYLLSEASPRARTLAELLSTEERSRAAAFSFAADRLRFVIGRAMLRSHIAGYTGVEPGDVQFRAGPHGKPELALPSDTRMGFSVSHSGEVVLLAFALDVSVGVDVEGVRRSGAERLAERFFSRAERDTVLNAEDRQASFCTLWTLKEAFLKAAGVGLSGIEGVEVAVSGETGARIVSAGASASDGRRWQAERFTPAPEHVAAIVYAP
jgi:4'-phosphopantetheinyl transferase